MTWFHMWAIENHFHGAPWACCYRTANKDDRLDEVTPDNDEENPEYTYEDREHGSFTFYLGGESVGAQTVETLDDGKCLVHLDLEAVGEAGLSLPAYLVAKKDYPSLRSAFPIGGSPLSFPWGTANHSERWEVAGRICPYTPEQAEAAAKAFVEKELPTVANRINWQPASRIRWGKFRANEPLILHTAGYVVAGEIGYGGIPLLNDTLSLAILGEDVISLSLTSHEIVEVAAQCETIGSCRLALAKNLAEIKHALNVEDNYAILNARLVYAGPLDLYSKEAMQELILYRPMWQVVFHTAPGRCACGHIRVVYLDAVSGDYVGCHAR